MNMKDLRAQSDVSRGSDWGMDQCEDLLGNDGAGFNVISQSFLIAKLKVIVVQRG